MRVYLDANCFNRPFDDQSQDRVRRESEAVLRILQRVLRGEDELVWSSALTLELSAHPEPEIREQLVSWAGRSREFASTVAPVRERADELAGQGLTPIDAVHVAFAEAARCDLFLTCDDALTRRAKRLGLSVRVVSPIEYVLEVTDAGAVDR